MNAKNMPDDSEIMTAKDLAKRFGLSVSSVKVYAKSGELPSMTHKGRDWLFRWGDVKNFKPHPRGNPTFLTDKNPGKRDYPRRKAASA